MIKPEDRFAEDCRAAAALLLDELNPEEILQLLDELGAERKPVWRSLRADLPSKEIVS